MSNYLLVTVCIIKSYVMHPVLTRTCPRDVVLIRWLHLEKEEWNISPIVGLIFSKIKKYVYVLDVSKRKVNRIRVFFPFAELKSPKSIVKNPTHNLTYCTLKTVCLLSLICILSKSWGGTEGYCCVTGNVGLCDIPWLWRNRREVWIATIQPWRKRN